MTSYHVEHSPCNEWAFLWGLLDLDVPTIATSWKYLAQYLGDDYPAWCNAASLPDNPDEDAMYELLNNALNPGFLFAYFKWLEEKDILVPSLAAQAYEAIRLITDPDDRERL